MHNIALIAETEPPEGVGLAKGNSKENLADANAAVLIKNPFKRSVLTGHIF